MVFESALVLPSVDEARFDAIDERPPATQSEPSEADGNVTDHAR